MVEISQDVLQVAKELGAALGASPMVQEYIQARDARLKDTQLQQLEAEIDQMYQDLITRQQNGEVLLPGAVNAFYDLREQYTRHPLVVEHVRCESAVKALFGQVGSTLNSILSVDYTQLAE